MSLLLLDTAFLIDAERSDAELDELIDDDDDVAIAAVTVAELLVGVKLANSRHRTRRAEYVEAIRSTVSVLDYDTRVAEEHAELLVAVQKAGTPRGAHDLIIAATARASGRTVVTADLSAFQNLPGVQATGHRDHA
ncbi:MAG: type II toxin-antitoxin system VapC family toxin [Sulfitobacter sp.]|nr:type II toxin-antitoxin system VapC family toxin [Sulfitobacter sp.]MCP3911971.1 type II toxin-antitoxin system VapC family toxin [Actinomycetes bacterium]